MHLTSTIPALALLATTTLATTTLAKPVDPSLIGGLAAKAAASAGTFNIQLYNNCHFTKQFALYQIVPGAYTMLQRSNPTNVPSKGHTTIAAPFKDVGMRLSGHAEWGTAAQWKAHALFEFGYSTYAGQEGTAYDLSVMGGSDKDIGIGVYPIANGKGSGKHCEAKTCFPWSCAPAQGWTDPDQTKLGSPADTTCYYGKTDFKVVFCP